MGRVWTLLIVSCFGLVFYHDKPTAAQGLHRFEGTRLASELEESPYEKSNSSSQHPVRPGGTLSADGHSGAGAGEPPFCVGLARSSARQVEDTGSYGSPRNETLLVRPLLREPPQQGGLLPRVWWDAAVLHSYAWTTSLATADTQAAVPQDQTTAFTQTKEWWWRQDGCSWAGFRKGQATTAGPWQGQGQGSPSQVIGPASTCSSTDNCIAQDSWRINGRGLRGRRTARSPAGSFGRLLDASDCLSGTSSSLPECQRTFHWKTSTQASGAPNRGAHTAPTPCERQADLLRRLGRVPPGPHGDGGSTGTKMSKVLEDFEAAENQWQAQLVDATEMQPSWILRPGRLARPSLDILTPSGKRTSRPCAWRCGPCPPLPGMPMSTHILHTFMML